METYTISLIAIALAMDAFAVSIVSGIAMQKLHMKHVLRIAVFFGAFQGAMPVIGWTVGNMFQEEIADYNHWIAFLLLTFLGLKMYYESKKLDVDRKEIHLSYALLFLLSTATSIDAFGVGFSFSLLEVDIILPAVTIAGVTFAMSFAGVYIGDIMGHLFERKIEALGGLILIFMGLRIFVLDILELNPNIEIPAIIMSVLG